MNVYSGEVRSWDSLSDAEKASGEWIKLPVDAGGFEGTRRRSFVDDIPIKPMDLSPKDLVAIESEILSLRIEHEQHRADSQFANRGRSR